MVAKVFFLKIKIVYKGHNFHVRIFAFKSCVSFYPFDISFSYSNSICQQKGNSKTRLIPKNVISFTKLKKERAMKKAPGTVLTMKCVFLYLCAHHDLKPRMPQDIKAALYSTLRQDMLFLIVKFEGISMKEKLASSKQANITCCFKMV